MVTLPLLLASALISAPGGDKAPVSRCAAVKKAAAYGGLLLGFI